MKLLLVGGTFDYHGGKESGLINKLYGYLSTISPEYNIQLTMYNGNYYHKLESILEESKHYDVVIWMPHVPNECPKIRDVKKVAPHTLLVSSKRNDRNKYLFQELINHALGLKAKLTIEFSKTDDCLYYMKVFDPLGTLWYEGYSLELLTLKLVHRLQFLLSITRQSTFPSEDNKSLVMAWYFNRFKEPEYKSENQVTTPSQEEFISLVKSYAECFHKYGTSKGSNSFFR